MIKFIRNLIAFLVKATLVYFFNFLFSACSTFWFWKSVYWTAIRKSEFAYSLNPVPTTCASFVFVDSSALNFVSQKVLSALDNLLGSISFFVILMSRDQYPQF